MAFSLSGERPDLAPLSTGFATYVREWLQAGKLVRARRTALAALLELEDFRLVDLGVSRADIVAVLNDPSRNAGRQLAFKRSLRASL